MNQIAKRELRSPREIRKMRAAGLIVWEAHQAAARMIKAGVTTAEINQVYRETFQTHGAQPLFLNYGEIPGERVPFPAETCISINDEVVHGIPDDRIVNDGDIVSVDTGCRLDGWCGDAAVTHAVGKVHPKVLKLLKVTNDVLDLAIKLMGEKSMWTEVCMEMEAFVIAAGFSVVEDMVGHGIGKELHEAPQVPNYLAADFAAKEDFDLRPGVVLAVEPMVNMGTHELAELDDGWTIVTEDGLPSAHFEHTIAITKESPQRLTGPPNELELKLLPKWLQDQSQWVMW